MRPENELALVVSYYLSRVDKAAVLRLGYSSFSDACAQIGILLNVKKNTIKNMRDEFDPYHSNPRIGWKRSLGPSRRKVMQAFDETDDDTLYEIVMDILQKKSEGHIEEYRSISNFFAHNDSRTAERVYEYKRGMTGKNAEKHYLNDFAINPRPYVGSIKDCRDLGCGYDFEILNQDKPIAYIEVKGLSADTGGISFTNKEWQTAKKFLDKYFLVLVRQVASVPSIHILRNPAVNLSPRKNVFATLQVNWAVDHKGLSSF